MTNYPAVCAIVLNWNGTRDTLECLNSLSALDRPLKTIILVDNASDDSLRDEISGWTKSIYPTDAVSFSEDSTGIAAMIIFPAIPVVECGVYPRPKREGVTPSPAMAETMVKADISASSIPAFIFLQNKINAGYAGGNNAGIKYAMSIRAYDFIWILNNDAVVAPDALSHLLNDMQYHPEAGIAGSTVVYFTDSDKVQCAGGCRYNPWTTIFSPLLSGQPLDRVLKIPGTPKMDYVYGASMFVRTPVFEKCGLFNDAYFLFYEEIDFCQKALKNGFKLIWCRNSIVRHKGSQSVGNPSTASNTRIAFANYHESLSALLYARSLHPLIFIFSMFFRFFGKIAVLAKKNELYLIKPLLAAYIDFFMGRNRKEHYEYPKYKY